MYLRVAYDSHTPKTRNSLKLSETFRVCSLLALAGQWETHIVNLVMGNISLQILAYKTIYRAVSDVTVIFLIVLAT